MSHLMIVANAYRVLGLVVGIPALIGVLTAGFAWITMPALPPADHTPLDIQKNGLVGLLIGGARVFSAGMTLFAGAMNWVLIGTLIASLAAALIGAAFFFIGRGLAAHAGWARAIAILISVLALLVSASLRNVMALIPLSLAIYTLWVLARRFEMS